METDTAELDALSPARPAYQRGLRPWQPGQSGNPGGRHKVTEAQKLCRELTPDAVATLAANLKDKNGQVSNMAAKILLEHAGGRPPAWGRPPVMSEDGNAVPDIVNQMLITEISNVFVDPPKRTIELKPNGSDVKRDDNAATVGN